MTTYTKEIKVQNKGEAKAMLTYEIETITILGTTYTAGTGLTSQELENKIKTEYPFKITITKNETNLGTTGGKGSFIITVAWPFESGNDTLDTYWGGKSYEYQSTHPTEKSLKIKIKLIAEQLST